MEFSISIYIPKPVFYLTGILLSLWLAWSFFQSPESYLKKKTRYLIEMASAGSSVSDLSMLSHVSKMAKYIHFDVHLKAEYEGQIYKAKSLNEFRSLLFSYFKYRDSREKVEYKNLNVSVEKSGKKALVSFDALFKRNEVRVFCKAFLGWVKEKKWYVKKIEVSSCSPAG